jgi:hypothetical protein
MTAVPSFICSPALLSKISSFTVPVGNTSGLEVFILEADLSEFMMLFGSFSIGGDISHFMVILGDGDFRQCSRSELNKIGGSWLSIKGQLSLIIGVNEQVNKKSSYESSNSSLSPCKGLKPIFSEIEEHGLYTGDDVGL